MHVYMVSGESIPSMFQVIRDKAVVLHGPQGCGKTYLAKNIAEFLKVYTYHHTQGHCLEDIISLPSTS